MADEAKEETYPKVTIKSNIPARADGGAIVALYEQHPQHPGGEIFVAGDVVVEAARTPDVEKALRDDRVVETKSAKKKADADPA